MDARGHLGQPSGIALRVPVDAWHGRLSPVPRRVPVRSSHRHYPSDAALGPLEIRPEYSPAMASYQLGSSEAELARLNRQGRVLAPATRILLQAAGLQAGMRVLDLGSGAGDVSLLAADIVGPAGSVLGIDQSPEAVAKATARAPGNVRFEVGDIHEPARGGPFDAVIGRLVLMYVPDPAAVLRAQASVLRPGGLVIPVEFDLGGARSLPTSPLAETALGWLRETFARAGIEPAVGPRLWRVLEEAGLSPAGMLAVQPHFGPGDPDGPFILAGIIRTLLAAMEATGVATAAEVGIDSLEARLAAEPIVFAHPPLFSAWARAD